MSYLYRMDSPAHREALYRLHIARKGAEHRDERLPCTHLDAAFFSSDTSTRLTAARLCEDCPVKPECAAVAPYESWGIWGGIDRQRVGAA